jgi:calcineurin-like phosphoesterase family protein
MVRLSALRNGSMPQGHRAARAAFGTMALFFTSDTHFGDHRTLNIHKRPFASAAAMDAALIERWNALVGPQDEVWHLGDFARAGSAAAGLLARLNGAST